MMLQARIRQRKIFRMYTYDIYGYSYVGERCLLSYDSLPDFSVIYSDCDSFMKAYDSTPAATLNAIDASEDSITHTKD